jgi:hypothetical protein
MVCAARGRHRDVRVERDARLGSGARRDRRGAPLSRYVQRGFPQYQRLFVLDIARRGARVGGSAPRAAPAAVADLASSTDARERRGRHATRRLQLVSAPIRKRGARIGTLVAALDIASLEAQLGETRSGRRRRPVCGRTRFHRSRARAPMRRIGSPTIARFPRSRYRRSSRTTRRPMARTSWAARCALAVSTGRWSSNRTTTSPSRPRLARCTKCFRSIWQSCWHSR